MFKKTITMIAVLCLFSYSTAYSAHHKSGEKKGKAQKDSVLAVPGALDFDAKTLEGKNLHLSQYLGDVLLVVNVASKCGRTPQYEDLQKLHEKYKDQGLKVIGFPANDFGRQEPGTNIEIREFCTANYGVTFDMMSKIHVKGSEIHPFYTFLTSEESNPDFGGEVKWNFEKFLIDRSGQVVGHFGSKTKPLSDQIVSAIESELKNKAISPGFKVYKGRTIAQTMHYTGADWLIRKKRETEESAVQMIKALNLKPGQIVCDLGSGNGYHTLMMAKKVGSTGKVLAVDIQKEMLELLKNRAKDSGI
ncbi:MAG: methyltransferase domain-containing protein, partial [Planctomycetes bacterium]|nr:methyltransferase domain-containing protein [Planctomycetota bacterium]